MKSTYSFLASLAAFGVTLAASPPAHAGLAECGYIDVEARSSCELRTGIECTGECTAPSFQAACAAQLEASCEGSCSASASVQCVGQCEAECEGECAVNPPRLDCQARCEAEGEAECNAQCSSSSNRSRCQASCKASFSAQCEASCEGQPGSATCQGKCEASCEGSCRAQANARCQVNCQASGFVQCEARLKGRCEIDCSSTGDGALYCNNQYVDHGGHLDRCLDALAAIDVVVQGSAQGRCSNGRCQGTAEGSVSCALSQPGSEANSAGGTTVYGLCLALGLAAAYRRRRH